MTDTVNNIETYLKFITDIRKKTRVKKGFVYHGMEDFVLQEGRLFPYRAKPKHIRFGKQKECFKNALHLAQATGWTYVEGYAMGFFPTLHAWVIDDDGFVVDNTWRGEQPAREYYGVAMPDEFVFRTVVKKKTYGVIENLEEDMPILKTKWKGEK